MPAISVEALAKQFNGKTAVKGISFSVEAGTIYGFLGPNGAGKTTTINILCTLLRPSGGRAFVNGHDCAREPDAVRRSIGIVFQDSTLDKDLTAYENLNYHAILYGLPRQERVRKVDEALRFIGLFDRRDELVKRYSGGMKRRLEVARAIIHQPDIIFLDEPTLGLDPQSRENLWSFINRLPGERGITIFMTTHYMDEAEVCDSIGIIDDGVLVANGSPEELKRGVGGDVVYLKTKDNEKAASEIRSSLGIDADVRGDEIFIAAASGEACIPALIREVGDAVISVRLQRPTLNDVFLKLTGKTIRDTATENTDGVRDDIRAYRRRHDR